MIDQLPPWYNFKYIIIDHWKTTLNFGYFTLNCLGSYFHYNTRNIILDKRRPYHRNFIVLWINFSCICMVYNTVLSIIAHPIFLSL